MVGEVVKRHQHDVLVDWPSLLLCQNCRELGDRPAPIAAAPDQRGGFVQVDGGIAGEVVHEQLAVELLSQQPLGAPHRPWLTHR
jgi:hypothetical protein